MPDMSPRLTIDTRERNPFPAHFDAVDLAEQQRVIREQHSKTQAGDTTFDYGLLLQATPNQLYTLGSVGRFYHDDFGMIHARYVQFMNCVETNAQAVPVGRLAAALDFKWIVTNSLADSAVDSAIGMICCAETPVDGSFGWVIIEGVVPAVAVKDSGTFDNNVKALGWAATGELSRDFAGPVIAIQLGDDTEEIQPGRLYVQVQTVSKNLIQLLISQSQSALASRVAALEAQVASLTQSAAIFEQATEIRLTQQEAKLVAEERARVRDIASVRESTGDNSLDPGAINIAVAEVKEELRIELDRIDSVISGIGYATIENRQDLTALDVPAQSQIDSLVTQLAGLSVRFRDFPLNMTGGATDGQVLTYDSASSSWTPSNLPSIPSSLNDLTDVDLAADPPTAGESLVYDGALWKPGP